MRRDRFSVRKRSEIMSHIRSRYTTLDMRMRRLLMDSGYQFKMYPRLYGHPDFLVAGELAVFCDSSFWHGRNWALLKRQLQRGANATYWVKHIEQNKRRDHDVSKKLRLAGYKVLRFWDRDILKKPESCLSRIEKALFDLAKV